MPKPPTKVPAKMPGIVTDKAAILRRLDHLEKVTAAQTALITTLTENLQELRRLTIGTYKVKPKKARLHDPVIESFLENVSQETGFPVAYILDSKVLTPPVRAARTKVVGLATDAGSSALYISRALGISRQWVYHMQRAYRDGVPAGPVNRRKKNAGD